MATTLIDDGGPEAPSRPARALAPGIEGPLAVGLGLALALLLTLGAGAGPARAAEASRHAAAPVIADPLSGAALFGYDPVAYALGAPARGSAAIAARVGGEDWRFVSEANRAAFLADPAAYRPAYGGRDGALVASGRVADGDPLVFARVEGRLHLFRDAGRRAAYLGDAALRRRAAEGWDALAAEL